MALDPEQFLHLTLGGFTLDEFVGHGTFAWVFRGHSEESASVALKLLTPRYAGEPQFESRFRNEAVTAARLDHPNIVRILDVGSEQGLTYLAMDFCPDSLANRMGREGPLAEDLLLQVSEEMAGALSFAHRAGVIHRDIKPDNLLSQEGKSVLADFGIAKAASAFVSATGKNMTIGTPHYLSPEQAQGRQLDGRSDLYSLGVTLYRSATGTLPFRSTDWYELARMHVEDPPVPPRKIRPELSEPLERMILRLLAKHPADRFASAKALQKETARIRAQLPIR
jgi:serine/threonine-protein kinase